MKQKWVYIYGSIYIKFSEIQTNLSNRKQIGGCLGMERQVGGGGRRREGSQNNIRKLGVWQICNTLIVVTVLQVYTYNKT